jgi:trans-aconitate methyltransferase
MPDAQIVGIDENEHMLAVASLVVPNAELRWQRRDLAVLIGDKTAGSPSYEDGGAS